MQVPQTTPVRTSASLSPGGIVAGNTHAASPSKGRRSRLLSNAIFWHLCLPLIEGGLIVLLFGACFALRKSVDEVHEIFAQPVLFTGGVLACCILLVLAAMGAYRASPRTRSLHFASELLLGTILGGGLCLFVIFVVFIRSPQFAIESRFAILLAATLFFPAAFAIRWKLFRNLAQLRDKFPVAVIGRPRALEEFAKTCGRAGVTNPLLKIPLDQSGSAVWPDKTCFQRGAIEAVVLVEPAENLREEDTDFLLRIHCDELPVLSLSAFYSSHARLVPTFGVNAAWIFERDFSLAEHSPFRFLKRGIDLVLSGLLLALFLPLFPLVALLIKLEYPGPVFYRQRRVGRHNREFTILKFRTMRQAAGSLYTAENDPRVTKFGGILRRLRIDELPQIFNVIAGEMSLIGPRPEWVPLVREYEKKIPGYHLRHLVRPGITGWAQVNYRYGASLEDAEIKLGYDLYYIQRYSLVLDIEIILKTVLSVFALRGR